MIVVTRTNTGADFAQMMWLMKCLVRLMLGIIRKNTLYCIGNRNKGNRLQFKTLSN